ncbi:hypothetical protein [Streptomyces sp. NPDC048111]|uniref:hypothetical protein n=1 Tax=Streptomyces sp. NPDC048111 TaxID=3365500 RepID=UPI00371EF9FE
MTVIGCPSLERLGGNTTTGGSLDFPRRAKTALTYGADGASEVSEKLYSDTPGKLSASIGRIFEAMASCPTYQVVSGTAAIDISTQATTARKSARSSGASYSPTPSAGSAASSNRQRSARAPWWSSLPDPQLSSTPT